jgi:hypothetical protein
MEEVILCCCKLLQIFTSGDTVLNGALNLVYFANIRAYLLLNNPVIRSDEKYQLIRFCPFCGAKLPDRLDETLTRILQNEYGLKSWKDYKKASTEFHTDEWWKKRGL